MSPSLPPGVVAVTATYRRPAEVRRLLESLERSAVRLLGAVVVDNGGENAESGMQNAESDEGAAGALEVRWVMPGRNLGCGGGLAMAEEAAVAHFGSALTHFWVLDDDAVVTPETLGELLGALEQEGAEAAHPLATAADGALGWTPGLTNPAEMRSLAVCRWPQEWIARRGDRPAPMWWAQGIALLVTRRAWDAVGPHRGDYWVRGEDLEFTLRLSHRFRMVYVPRARVVHLPPPAPAGGAGASRAEDLRKHCAMLQNIAYTGVRLPHGRRLLRTVPGNVRQFVGDWGLRPATLWQAARAFWRGAVAGKPAGVG